MWIWKGKKEEQIEKKVEQIEKKVEQKGEKVEQKQNLVYKKLERKEKNVEQKEKKVEQKEKKVEQKEKKVEQTEKNVEKKVEQKEKKVEQKEKIVEQKEKNVEQKVKKEEQKKKKEEEYVFPTADIQRVFSGIQPTGVPHLGNYISAISQWVKMQEKYEHMMISIVDLHSITVSHCPKQLRENIYTMTACLLASGILPEKTILFQQSMVPHHTQLSWILGCMCTLPRLAQLPQWKEKSAKQGEQKIGLYTYPLLQSADILLYKSTVIPVGEDQITHLELTRDCAKAFNRIYGPVFPQCAPLIGSLGKLKSLKEPTEKMSKSDPSGFSRINLDDAADIVQQKLRKATTDSVDTGITYDPENRPGLANLINIDAALTGRLVEDVVNDIQKKGLNKKDYKDQLAEVINVTVQPIRREMTALLGNKDYLDQVLKQGSKKASAIADETLHEVMVKVGLR